MCENDNITYKQDLVKSFHQQFAENQNNHQSTFIQMLSIILTVIIGFGLALLNFGDSSTDKDFKFTLFEFTTAFSIAEGILTLGFYLVVSYAYGYRRDQFVNAIIREKAGIIEDCSEPIWRIFPTNYNPKKSFLNKKQKKECFLWLKWMPDFHVVFSIAFIILQIFLIFSYILKCKKDGYLYFAGTVDGYSLLIFIIGFLFAIISIIGLSSYYKKIKDLYNKTSP